MFKEQLSFLKRYSIVFEIKYQVLGHIKPRFVFWLKINFGKMASDEHIDLRNIENIVRGKYYPEDISKD